MLSTIQTLNSLSSIAFQYGKFINMKYLILSLSLFSIFSNVSLANVEVVTCGKIKKIESDNLSIDVTLKNAMTGDHLGLTTKSRKTTHQIRIIEKSTQEIYQKIILFKSELLAYQTMDSTICLSSKIEKKGAGALDYTIENIISNGTTIDDAFKALLQKIK